MDDFIVYADKVPRLRTFKQKIERIYNVTICFDNVFTERSSVNAKPKQWVKVAGESSDRKNAKEYVLGVCQPEEIQNIVEVEGITGEEFEEVERQTNAVIEVNSTSAMISGTELAVTLAMSSVSDLISQRDSEDDGTPKDSTEPWSERLDQTLLRALSNQSDSTCSLDDYSQTPAAVKRVILSCLSSEKNDNEDVIDDTLMFSSQASNMPSRNLFGCTHEKDQSDLVSNRSKEVPALGSLAQQFTQTNISRIENNDRLAKERDYLRTFGISVGYASSVVEEGLSFVDEQTNPSDFLEILSGIKSSHEKAGKQTGGSPIASPPRSPQLGKANGKFPPPPDVPDMCSPSKFTGRRLPKSYQNQLMKDFSEEHGELSVDELKRRNEERQQLLKQAFEKEKTERREVSRSPHHNKPSGKKKKKGKSQHTNTQQQNRGKTNVSENPNTGVSSRQGRFVDLTMEDDDEETCVLKPWRKSDSESDDECQIIDHQSPHPLPVVSLPRPQQTRTDIHERQIPSLLRPFNVPHHPVNRGVQPTGGVPLSRGVQPTGANQRQPTGKAPDLRYIVIDGSNVAMSHGNGKSFSCKGIQICIDHFLQRGHKQVTAFVPEWRKYRQQNYNPIQITNQELLFQLKEQGHLVFTPSRRVNGRLISSYDDRFVLELAEREDGVIVSNDQYRDLAQEKASWRCIIEERLLMFTFAGNNFMIPEDPLGQNGPKLDEFLQKTPKQPSPLHAKRPLSPDKANRMFPEPLFNTPPPALYNYNGQQQFQQVSNNFQNFPRLPGNNQNVYIPNDRGVWRGGNPWRGGNRGRFTAPQQRQSVPHQKHQIPTHRYHTPQQNKFTALSIRSEEETQKLHEELKSIFPEKEQEQKILEILRNHGEETDLTRLTNYCMNAMFN